MGGGGGGAPNIAIVKSFQSTLSVPEKTGSRRNYRQTHVLVAQSYQQYLPKIASKVIDNA